MAERIPRTGEGGTGDEAPWEAHRGDPQEGETPRQPGISEPWWQECLRQHRPEIEAECIELIEIVYGIGDLHARAQDMKLDFLCHLLGVAFQEALEQLRERDPIGYPMPPAK